MGSKKKTQRRRDRSHRPVDMAASPPIRSAEHPGWLDLPSEIALIAFAAVITLLLGARLSILCWRKRQRRRLALLAECLERDWLDEGGAMGKQRSAHRRPIIVLGTENTSDGWTSTVRGNLQASLLGSSPSGSPSGSSPSGGDGGNEAEVPPQPGWRLLWRDASQRGKLHAQYLRYERVRILGRGARGTAVLLRAKKGSGDLVVSKELPLAALDVAQLSLLQNEVRILATLQHESIIKYHCSFPRADATTLNIIMYPRTGGARTVRTICGASLACAHKTGVRFLAWIGSTPRAGPSRR